MSYVPLVCRIHLVYIVPPVDMIAYIVHMKEGEDGWMFNRVLLMVFLILYITFMDKDIIAM